MRRGAESGTPSGAMSDALKPLIEGLREAATLNSVLFALEWDEQTQMPPGGAEHRANQKALLARLTHEKATAPALGEALARAEAAVTGFAPDADDAVIVRQARRAYDRAVKLPGSLVEETARVTAHAHHAWVDARKHADAARFAPWLARVIDLCQQKARCLGAEGQSAYDTLVDEYEPGATTAELNEVFGTLKAPLVALVAKVGASGRAPRRDLMTRAFAVEVQERVGRIAAEKLGYDFARGRLDVSVHPFSITLGPGDSRITTRYHANRFGDSFFGVLHETGHALYEQGLLPEHFGTGLGEAASLGLHESQSRLWENLVGRSRPFWAHFWPIVRDAFGATLADVREEEFLFAANDIRPSPIRVEADEVTYNLHILLRFEIEQALISGDLKPHDVDAAWNDKLRALLGITPRDAAEGCLQDVHWSGASFGYFPTYTLGNLYGAQLFEAARRDLGDGLDVDFARGDFSALRGWLRKHVHAHGQRYLAKDLVTRVSGKPFSADAFLRHVNSKAETWFGV